MTDLPIVLRTATVCKHRPTRRVRALKAAEFRRVAMAAVIGLAIIPVVAIGAQLSAQSPAARPRVTEQQSPTTQLLQAIHAVNSQVVWASGHGGAVLRTINGGASWETRPTPAGDSIQFRDVHALNADTAWIMSAGSGKASRVYRTNNGGETWTLQHMNTDSAAFYDCMAFLDRNVGIVYSDQSNGRTMILRTANGGASWGWLPPTAVPAPLASEGAFASSGLCVVAPDATNALIGTGAPGARLFRSHDVGKTWTAGNTPIVHGKVAGITGLAFKDVAHGIAVGADIDKLRTDTSSHVVATTNDGGKTWALQTRPPLPGALSGVAWVPGAGANVAVVVGFGGSFFTRDAGHTWETLNNQLFTGVTAVGRTAWIAGGGGKIIRLEW